MSLVQQRGEDELPGDSSSDVRDVGFAAENFD